MIRLLILIITLTVCATGICYATPSSLASIPSAEVAKPGSMSVAFSARGKSGDDDVTKCTDILVAEKRFECGVDVAENPNSSVGNFKIAVVDGGKAGASVAIGMMDLSNKTGSDIDRLYMTAGRRFGKNKFVFGLAEATGKSIKSDK